MPQEIKFNKSKSPRINRRLFDVDLAGFEPASSGTNTDMLPHTPQAQAHGLIVKQKWPLWKETYSGYPTLAHSEPCQCYILILAAATIMSIPYPQTHLSANFIKIK